MTQSVPLARAIGGYIFGLLQACIRFVFRLIYGHKGESVPPITDPILLESATSLARKIRNQEVSAQSSSLINIFNKLSPFQLSSVQVLESFIRRIKEVNPILNCVVDERYDQALKEAAEADALIKSGQYSVEELAKQKPFLGVPITTKDCISVKGA